jgi:hypothetical protein
MERATVYGVGINDADYTVNKCKIYKLWRHYLCEQYRDGHPKRPGAGFCQEWLRFSNFKAWLERQDWVGKFLYSGLLVPGETVHSPATSCFISKQLSEFLGRPARHRTPLPTGVTWNYRHRRFLVHVYEGGRSKYIGSHSELPEAFAAWLAYKQEHASTIACAESDSRVPPAVVNFYNNYPVPDFSLHPERHEFIRYGMEAYKLRTSVSQVPNWGHRGTHPEAYQEIRV